MKKILLGVVFLFVVVVVGIVIWFRWPSPIQPCDLANYKENNRDADHSLHDPWGDNVQEIRYLEQGWKPHQSMDFYTRTQGSRLVPYTWFLALEQSDHPELFRENANLNRLRYLPQKASACNPDGLPVGFIRDPKREGEREDWVGLTCAACHTTQINYANVGYRIDGGPTLANLQLLLRELHLSMKATLEQQEKFDKFAVKVLPRNHTPDEKAKLKAELAERTQFRMDYENRNATAHPDGYGRLDAFGRIMNEVLVRHLRVADPDQVQPPNAPVSYPFLWDTPHHEVVQWNGIASNRILGSNTLGGLARNVGEVLGVFGDVIIPNKLGIAPGYAASVRVPDLLALENLVRELRSPQWPKEFPVPDPKMVEAGAAKFKFYCAACHDPIDRKDKDRLVKARLSPLEEVGTDPMMARNFAMRVAKTGPLKGRNKLVKIGSTFGPEAGGDEILVHVVVGVILNTPFNDFNDDDLRKLRNNKLVNLRDGSKLVYRSRPLNGIWATAPYLHNGSVANLYQLLLPAKDRWDRFQVGRREFDPTNVGFVREPAIGGYEFRVNDDRGQPIPGNSKAGHEYGTGKTKDEGGDDLPVLLEIERRQIVEYLKTL